MMRKLAYALLAFGFLLLYAFTAQRGVSWQDSGEFQYRILTHDYFWISGIARSHPAYIAAAELFASLFPETLVFFALNLFSGIGMVLALLLLARVLASLGVRTSAILGATLTLGLAHMVWWMSTIAEVYTWSLALFLAEIACAARLCRLAPQEPEERVQGSGNCTALTRTWILLALLNGLHAAFHNFAFLNLPVYALLFIYLQRTSRFSIIVLRLIACCCAWLIGASLLIALFVIEWQATASFVSALKSLLFGHEFSDVVMGTRAVNWPLALSNLALACVSLLNPGWLLAIFGWLGHRKHALFKGTLLTLTLVHFVFWIRYFVPDQATFVMPLLALLALWVGLGWDGVIRSQKIALVLAGLILFSALAAPMAIHQALEMRQGGVKRARALPFREEDRYWLFPWKQNESSAVLFVEHVRRILKEGDILIADNTAAGPIMAAQAAGLLSPKIRIIAFFTGETDDELARIARTHERVYIVSPVPGYASYALLTGAFTFEKEDVLYRIRSAKHD